MKKSLAAGLAMVIFCCTGTFAQTVPDGSPSSSQAVLDGHAATEPSQAQIDAATDFLTANNTVANVGVMLETISPLVAAQIKREHPAADDKTIAILVGVMRNAVMARKDEMIHLYAIGYARHFSAEELKALTEFYRSPVGQKYMQEQPALTKDITPIGIAWTRNVIAAAVDDAIRKARAEGVKI